MSKKTNPFLNFHSISLVIFVGVLFGLFLILGTFNYYTKKHNQWFEYLPANTAFAVKLNTSLVNQTNNTKLLSLLDRLNSDSKLSPLLKSYKQSVTVVVFENQGQLEFALVSTRKEPKFSTLYAHQISKDLYIYLESKDLLNAFNFSKSLDQSAIYPQLKNHPSNSYAYLAISPKNIQKFLFRDQLLDSKQKALDSLLKTYDNIFFNIESNKNQLLISNYQEFDPKITKFITSSIHFPNASDSIFTTQISDLNKRLPTLFKMTLTHVLKNFNLDTNLVEGLLDSTLTISKDKFSQWQINILPETQFSKTELSNLISFLEIYFNPQPVDHLLKTNQKAQISHSKTNLNSPKTLGLKDPIKLESLNKFLHIIQTPESISLFFTNTNNIQLNENSSKLTTKNPDFFNNVMDFSSFNLGVLNTWFDSNLPSYDIELYTRNYSFGQHTLIVLE